MRVAGTGRRGESAGWIAFSPAPREPSMVADFCQFWPSPYPGIWKGFDVSNLRYMRLFYQAFPIRDALRHELSWTHYRILLKVEQQAARSWHMTEAAAQGWTTRRWSDRSTPSFMSGCWRLPINQLSNRSPSAPRRRCKLPRISSAIR